MEQKIVKLKDISTIYTSVTIHDVINKNRGLEFLFIPKLLNAQKIFNLKIVDDIQEQNGFYIVNKGKFDLVYLSFILDSLIFRHTITNKCKNTNNITLILKNILSEFPIPVIDDKELIVYKYTETLLHLSLVKLSQESGGNVNEVLLHSYMLKELKDALVLELFYPRTLGTMNIFIYPEWEKIVLNSINSQDVENEIFKLLFSQNSHLLNSIKKLRVIWKDVINNV